MTALFLYILCHIYSLLKWQMNYSIYWLPMYYMWWHTIFGPLLWQELVSIGCIADRWSSLIGQLMSSSYESLTISKLYHNVHSISLGRSQDLCSNAGSLNSKVTNRDYTLEVRIGLILIVSTLCCFMTLEFGPTSIDMWYNSQTCVPSSLHYHKTNNS